MIRQAPLTEAPAWGKEAGQMLLSMVKPPAAASTPPGPRTPSTTPGTPATTEEDEQIGLDLKLWSDINGLYYDADEVQSGPDGELYEISYPTTQHTAEEMTMELIQMLDSSDKDEIEEVEELEREPTPTPMEWLQVTAATGVVMMLDAIHKGNVDLYPARTKLFEAVRECTNQVWGDRVDRLALVGSTALGVATPSSDLDAVLFTKPARFEYKGQTYEDWLDPLDVLWSIGEALKERNLDVQMIDTARVPLLIVRKEDISLDLTVDRPLGEWHVQWFYNQEKSLAVYGPKSLTYVPYPGGETSHDSSFVASVLRSLKWWLRRRKIPTAKEGGYPSLVWSLMVMHVLRCSLLWGEAAMDGSQSCELGEAVLTALAAFFDRFGGNDMLSGTLLFADGLHAEFRPQLDFSVLDPTCTATTPNDVGAAELAPRLSLATQLLHAYELRRAKGLSALALAELRCEVPSDDLGMSNFEALFDELSSDANFVPAPTTEFEEPQGAIFLSYGILTFGLLKKVEAPNAWNEPFLHRRDTRSVIQVHLCQVNADTGLISPTWLGSKKAMAAFHPHHFVCLATVEASPILPETYGDLEVVRLTLDAEALARWQSMQEIIGTADSASPWSQDPEVPPARYYHHRNKRAALPAAR
mmetsp:Transcript_19960/g.46448  ORF Transcript_19960/g.46448 Transcript_19960/m.46448 type:complete len:641 (+) Transcript_19960:60-1982(+)|eukprot:CAMPEP_0178400110 /NCGR_PEP_ID=MMETSP0689_2-20121128/15621_1 /TAXON_ID=160604 /ORGANISM="Amphidinium massartii, Strain CS-259" /LENGTH=640 /DNA_ID=CAMNT_0020020897 /DNA_START=47 /DNA_END=1969 /DNA_ORIENTATION=+